MFTVEDAQTWDTHKEIYFNIVTIQTHLAILGLSTLCKTIMGKWFQGIFLISPLRMAFRRSGVLDAFSAFKLENA